VIDINNARTLRLKGHFLGKGIVDLGALSRLKAMVGQMNHICAQHINYKQKHFLSAIDACAGSPSAKLFLRSFCKTLIAFCRPAFDVGISKKMIQTAQEYYGEKRLFLEHSLAAHPVPNESEGSFKYHSEVISTIKMLLAWIPLDTLYSGQEILFLPYSNHAGKRGEAALKVLPRKLLKMLSRTHSGHEDGDAVLFSGRTLHAAQPNRRPTPMLALTCRFLLLEPKYQSYVGINGENIDFSHVSNLLDAKAIHEILLNYLPGLLDVLKDKVDFSALDYVALLRDDFFVRHPDFGRMIRYILEFEIPNLKTRWMPQLPTKGVYIEKTFADPEYLTHTNVQIGYDFLREKNWGRALDYLMEAEFCAANADIIYEEARNIGNISFCRLISEANWRLGYEQRYKRFEALIQTLHGNTPENI